MPYIENQATKIYYEEHGPATGAPVLLIMGLGMQLIAWPPAFIDALVAAGKRVIVFDNRDVGLSTHFSGAPAANPVYAVLAKRLGLPLKLAYTLTDMARDTVALLEGLSIKSAHIVGVSMGGMIAQILAADFPQYVASLTSIMSSSGASGLPGAAPHLRKMMIQGRPARASREELIAYSTKLLGLLSFPDPARTPDAFVEAATNAYDRAYNPIGIKRQLIAILADGSRVRRLAKVTAPSLVIHGAKDELVPLACAHDLVRRIPGARLQVIDDMAHDLPPSQVGVMAGLILTHIAGAKPA